MKRDVADTVKLSIYIGGHASHRSVPGKEWRNLNEAWRWTRSYEKLQQRQWAQWWGQQSWGDSSRQWWGQQSWGTRRASGDRVIK